MCGRGHSRHSEPRSGVFTPPAPRHEEAAPAPVSAPAAAAEALVAPVEETPGGNVLNIVLGFEATDLKT